MSIPDWEVAQDNLKPVLEILEPLTPDQRVKLFEWLEEEYCFNCGRCVRFCRCDRW